MRLLRVLGFCIKFLYLLLEISTASFLFQNPFCCCLRFPCIIGLILELLQIIFNIV